MSKYAHLSKDELLAILEKQREPSIKQSKPPNKKNSGSLPEKVAAHKEVVEKKCEYVAGKNKEACAEIATTPYGFCKKHVRTLQAKTARETYEANCIVDIEDVSEPLEKPAPVEKPVRKPKTQVPEKKPQKEVLPTPKQTNDNSKNKTTGSLKPTSNKSTTNTKDIPEKPSNKENIKVKKIRRNRWDLFEDTESHIVFDPNTKEAFGIQENTGAVSALKPEHVALCIKNGWNYKLPYNDDDESEEEESSIAESDFDESDDDEEEELVDSEDEEDEDEESGDDEDESEEDEDESEEDEDDDEDEDDEDDDEDDEDESEGEELVDSEETSS